MADPIKFKGIDRIVYGVGDMASGTRFFNISANFIRDTDRLHTLVLPEESTSPSGRRLELLMKLAGKMFDDGVLVSFLLLLANM